MKKLLLIPAILFLSVSLLGQSPEVYVEVNGTPCVKKIILYPNGDYYFQSGCDVALQASFGKWTQKKDTLKVDPIDPKTYRVIKNISANTIPSDSIWVAIFDEDGVNITSKISMGLEVNGRGSYMFSPDNTGTKKFVYKRPDGKLMLRTLAKLFNRPFEFSTDSTNNFIITVALRANWISSTHAAWSGFGAIRLLKKGTDLIALMPQRVLFRRVD